MLLTDGPTKPQVPGNQEPVTEPDKPFGLELFQDPGRPASPGNQPIIPEEEIEIDPRFEKLDPAEATIRTLQSIKSKQKNQIDNLTAQLTQKTVYEDMFGKLLKDENMFMSLVATVKPELLAVNEDIDVKVKKQLEKEFPNFTPIEEEITKRGTKSFIYAKREEALINDFASKGVEAQKHPKLQELLADITTKEEAEKSKRRVELTNVQQKFGWDLPTTGSFLQWWNKLKIEHAAQIYDYILKSTPGGNLRGIEFSPTAPSAPTGKVENVEAYINSILGPPRFSQPIKK